MRHIPLFIVLQFFKFFKKDKYQLWKTDIASYKCNFFKLLFERPYYVEILYYRLGRWSRIFKLLSGRYPLFINSETAIMGGIKLDHPHYTHINAKYIGKNFQTKHNVTIGSNHNGLPIIGDNCFVGCGAAILGPITIGNNVRISANTVVVHSVPDNCLVVGNPAYIIAKDGVKTFIKL